MKLSIIAAFSSNRVIGKNQALPWHLPADLRFFKKMTMGRCLLMGRKTFESMAGLLPGRRLIVITRQQLYAAEGVEVAGSIQEALEKAPQNQEVFVAGGAEIYSAMLPLVDRMYLTLIHREFEGDTFFPHFDESEWELIAREDHQADEQNRYPFSFLTYQRRSKPNREN